MKKILALGYLAGIIAFLVVMNMLDLSFWPAAILLVICKVLFTVPTLIADYNGNKEDILRFLPLFQGVVIKSKSLRLMSVTAGILVLLSAILAGLGLSLEIDTIFIAGLITLALSQLLNGMSRSSMILAVSKRTKAKRKATHSVIKLLMCAILFVPLLDSVGMLYPMFLSMKTDI